MLTRHVADTTVYWKNSPTTSKPTTLVMIHGFRGTHHGLLRIADHLPEEYQVIIPDLPGFGESTPLASHTLEDFTLWLHSFIDELNLDEPPVLVGHSFGSIVASSYAATYPETITRLILINPIGAPALEGPKAIMTKLAILYYKIGEKLPERPARHWLGAKSIVRVMSVTMAKTKDRSLRRYIHNQHDQYFSRFASPQSVLEAFTTSTENDVRQVATQLSMPSLLIAGEKDDITSVSKQRELLKLLPNGELKVIAGVGHLTHYETPSEVAEYIYDFIKSE